LPSTPSDVVEPHEHADLEAIAKAALTKAEKAGDDVRQLKRDVFGDPDRRDDNGAVGGLAAQLTDLRADVRAMKAWAQGLVAALVVSLVGGIIALVVTFKTSGGKVLP
jgi:hypothetical protein